MQIVKGSCPICHQVIDVDLDNQANICPFCKQAYVSQAAVDAYRYQNNQSDLEAYVTKIKRLLHVNMVSEAYDLIRQVQRLYPDKYQSWLLDIWIETNEYQKKYFEDLTLTWKQVKKVDDLRQLDHIQDEAFQKWFQSYRVWIINNDTAFALCNQLPPLEAFEILDVVQMKKAGIAAWQPANFYIYENMIPRDATMADIYYENPAGNGLTITYIYKEKDYRFTGRYDYEKISFVLKLKDPVEVKFPLLKQAIQNVKRRSGCCPYCGNVHGLFGKGYCRGQRTNASFYWMRNK